MLPQMLHYTITPFLHTLTILAAYAADEADSMHTKTILHSVYGQRDGIHLPEFVMLSGCSLQNQRTQSTCIECDIDFTSHSFRIYAVNNPYLSPRVLVGSYQDDSTRQRLASFKLQIKNVASICLNLDIMSSLELMYLYVV